MNAISASNVAAMAATAWRQVTVDDFTVTSMVRRVAETHTCVSASVAPDLNHCRDFVKTAHGIDGGRSAAAVWTRSLRSDGPRGAHSSRRRRRDHRPPRTELHARGSDRRGQRTGGAPSRSRRRPNDRLRNAARRGTPADRLDRDHRSGCAGAASARRRGARPDRRSGRRTVTHAVARALPDRPGPSRDVPTNSASPPWRSRPSRSPSQRMAW